MTASARLFFFILVRAGLGQPGGLTLPEDAWQGVTVELFPGTMRLKAGPALPQSFLRRLTGPCVQFLLTAEGFGRARLRGLPRIALGQTPTVGVVL